MTAFYINVDGPFGGNIRASVRRESDNYFWDENTTAFVDPDGVGFIFDNSTVDLPAVGGVRGAYQVSFPFTSTYSGKLLVGVHDENNGNLLVDQVKVTSRSGQVVENVVISRARENIPVDSSLVFYLSRRSDGTVGANRTHFVDVGAVDLRFALDASGLFSDNINVADIGTPVVSAAGELAVSAIKPRDQQAILSIDGGQVAGNSYTVTTPITMDSGDQFNGIVDVTCRAK